MRLPAAALHLPERTKPLQREGLCHLRVHEAVLAASVTVAENDLHVRAQGAKEQPRLTAVCPGLRSLFFVAKPAAAHRPHPRTTSLLPFASTNRPTSVWRAVLAKVTRVSCISGCADACTRALLGQSLCVVWLAACTVWALCCAVLACILRQSSGQDAGGVGTRPKLLTRVPV